MINLLTILEKVFYFIGKFLSKFYNSKISYSFKLLRAKFTTGFYSKSFKSIGYSCYIHPEVNFRGVEYIELGNHSSIGSYSTIETYQSSDHIDSNETKLLIGNNVSIGEFAHITTVNQIRIDDNVLIGKRVLISDNSHGYSEYTLIAPINRPVVSKGSVHINKNVWIGSGVVITPGVVIGKNCIVGANSVVTHSIPEDCVVAGIPAKIIKKLR